jgi:2-amino-4-hydroxy-6-hydroxymethyldihydropteridine diphosphokinase
VENSAFIALGSNIENRYNYLVSAIQLLNQDSKIKVINISSIYETDPVGYEDQDLFLNMAVKISTDYSAAQLLDVCLQVEHKLGRKREVKWGPRTIDLDIILFNHENIETENLIIPHPRMKERAFVMIPLLEIEQDLFITNMEKPLKLYLNELPNIEGVRVWKQKNGEDAFEPIGS